MLQLQLPSTNNKYKSIIILFISSFHRNVWVQLAHLWHCDAFLIELGRYTILTSFLLFDDLLVDVTVVQQNVVSFDVLILEFTDVLFCFGKEGFQVGHLEGEDVFDS
jgi:DNA polymerase sigma